MKFRYKNIAILTDNPFLGSEFYSIISNYFNELNKVDFFTSPYTSISSFTLKSLKIIDVKNNKDVDILIEEYDLVFSIHSKQLFPSKLVTGVKCINVHPGFNPVNRGWYPQVFSIINNTMIGATIHEIDEKLDHGAIIAQKTVKKYSNDTSLTLYNRVVNAEIDLIKLNLEKILSDKYFATEPIGEGNLYLKKDFNKLKKIELDKVSTYGEVINHLRAMSHGSYKNAYFLDDDGKKIFIKVQLDEENN